MSTDSSRRTEHSWTGDPVGYSDVWSAAPGQPIQFKVSTTSPDYRAAVLRLSGGTPAARKPIRSPIDGTYPGVQRETRPGSHVVVNEARVIDSLTSLTVSVWVWPTLLAETGQEGLVSARSWSLFLDTAGCPSFMTKTINGTSVVRSTRPLLERQWILICASYDSALGGVSLYCHPIGPHAAGPELISTVGSGLLCVGGSTLWMAARTAENVRGAQRVHDHFNGKLEAPTLYSRPLTSNERAQLVRSQGDEPPSQHGLVGAWRFQHFSGTDRVVDIGPYALDGRIVNAPARAMTGHRWRGRDCDPARTPIDYGAIHFHSDDLDDSGWDTDFTLTVPAGWSSGLYAVEVKTLAGRRDLMPFVVRPGDEATADVAVILPTMTYLAYANEKLPDEDSYSGYRTSPDIPISPWDAWLVAHPEFGMSLYDAHDDGSGCCYSSRLRPVPAMRPDYVSSQLGFPRHLAADILLFEWLAIQGIATDVVTDEDVDNEGAELLSRYRVVLTGSHPEYVTERIFDAVENYVAAGGRLMYLGGNGFFWVTSLSKERRRIEVRRGQTNRLPWDSCPGETHHSTTGELGGLWVRRGRSAHALFGVGFAAMGLHAQPYERTPESRDPRYAWIFDGLSADALVGEEGRILGAAGGHEIDSYDPVLGSPSRTAHLARAQGNEKNFELATPGSLFTNKPPTSSTQYPCADLTYLEYPDGGAVFSVGSMAWIGSLLDSPSVSTVTKNVLSSFRAKRLPTAEVYVNDAHPPQRACGSPIGHGSDANP